MKPLILLPALAAVSTSVRMVSRASMLTGRWLSQTGGARVTPQTWPDTWPARWRAADSFGRAKRDKVPDGLLAWRTFVNAPILTKPNPDYALGTVAKGKRKRARADDERSPYPRRMNQ